MSQISKAGSPALPTAVRDTSQSLAIKLAFDFKFEGPRPLQFFLPRIKAPPCIDEVQADYAATSAFHSAFVKLAPQLRELVELGRKLSILDTAVATHAFSFTELLRFRDTISQLDRLQCGDPNCNPRQALLMTLVEECGDFWSQQFGGFPLSGSHTEVDGVMTAEPGTEMDFIGKALRGSGWSFTDHEIYEAAKLI